MNSLGGVEFRSSRAEPRLWEYSLEERKECICSMDAEEERRVLTKSLMLLIEYDSFSPKHGNFGVSQMFQSKVFSILRCYPPMSTLTYCSLSPVLVTCRAWDVTGLVSLASWVCRMYNTLLLTYWITQRGQELNSYSFMSVCHRGSGGGHSTLFWLRELEMSVEMFKRHMEPHTGCFLKPTFSTSGTVKWSLFIMLSLSLYCPWDIDKLPFFPVSLHRQVANET